MNPTQDNTVPVGATPTPLVAQRVPTSEETRTFFQKVYFWMFAGLVVSGIVASMVASNENWLNFIFGTPYLFYALLIGEILLVVWLSRGINSMSSQMATILYFIYCITTGITLSIVCIAYTTASINTTLIITAGMFGIISLYGYTTKADLSRTGNIAFMGLIGLVLAGLVNMFVQNSMVDLILSGVGVLVFTVLTAYDTQKIKNLANNVTPGSENSAKSSIIGALTLYLDFLNLFLDLLRFVGKRK